MRKQLYILALFCLCVLCARAETVVLRTGARVKGTIVFQNEEVVIVRDATGARFQYPRTDVESVLTDDAEEEVVEEQVAEEQVSTKKASILLELAGGVAVIPGNRGGGVAYSVDLLVGSHHIGDRHLFIGGGLGYHGMVIDRMYHFLPIQVALRMPFTETKHAPVFGLGIGYGIALSKDYVGGLYTGIDFGYRCQINPRTAVSVVAFARFQQAVITVHEEPLGPGTSLTDPAWGFSHKVGRNIVTPGLKFALYF